jgi:hypothetical protein
LIAISDELSVTFVHFDRRGDKTKVGTETNAGKLAVQLVGSHPKSRDASAAANEIKRLGFLLARHFCHFAAKCFCRLAARQVDPPAGEG